MTSPPNRRGRAVLGLLLSAAVVAVAYAGLVLPLRDELQASEKNEWRLRSEFASLQRIATSAPAAREALATAVRQFESVSPWLPSEFDRPALRDHFDNAAIHNQAVLESLTFAEQQQFEFYALQSISLSVRGSLNALYDYLNVVTGLSPFVRVKHVAIAASAEGTVATIQVHTYRYIEEGE